MLLINMLIAALIGYCAYSAWKRMMFQLCNKIGSMPGAIVGSLSLTAIMYLFPGALYAIVALVGVTVFENKHRMIQSINEWIGMRT